MYEKVLRVIAQAWFQITWRSPTQLPSQDKKGDNCRFRDLAVLTLAPLLVGCDPQNSRRILGVVPSQSPPRSVGRIRKQQ